MVVNYINGMIIIFTDNNSQAIISHVASIIVQILCEKTEICGTTLNLSNYT